VKLTREDGGPATVLHRISPPRQIARACERCWNTHGIASSQYQHGRDTWILAVSGGSGAFINGVDGSLPIIVGRFSGQVFATRPGDPEETRYSFQLVRMIGDTSVFGSCHSRSETERLSPGGFFVTTKGPTLLERNGRKILLPRSTSLALAFPLRKTPGQEARQ